MDLGNAWTVALKDFKVFRKKKNVIYSTVLFPLIVAVGIPVITHYAGANKGGIPAAALPGLLNAFAFFFVLGAASLPTAIASFSLVGEKVQKSLEPLLATPVSDGEILLGKTISALLPPIAAIYAGAVLFMALMDKQTYSTLGYSYFPNWSIGIILLVVVPLASLISVEVNVILSSRMSDVRAVQQLGGLMVLPFAGIYVASEIGLLTLDTNTLLTISGLMLVIVLALFFVSTATFRREEILTAWK